MYYTLCVKADFTNFIWMFNQGCLICCCGHCHSEKTLEFLKKFKVFFFKLLVLFTKLLVLFKGLYTDLLNWVCLSVSPIIFPTFFEYREFVLFLFLEMTIGTLSHSDIC